jgi:predicted metalloprotease with PDZ domain
MLPRLVMASSLALAAGAADAQDSRSDHVPPPLDTRYPGMITLQVDASSTTQGIFRVHETLPVSTGELTLLYPQWIPGDHSPTGPIAMLAGLELSANGKPLVWKRDEYNVYAFHLDVPAGVARIDATFQYLSGRTESEGFDITGQMMDMEWSKVALYPAGYFSRDITFAPSVTLANGWQLGTALETAYAGQYFKRVDLSASDGAPVHLDIFADAPKYLEMTPEQLAVHRALVKQATTLFGSHHYGHYDFLFSLSDQLGGNGTEHHQSSEDGLGADYFTAWNDAAPDRDLLAHE